MSDSIQDSKKIDQINEVDSSPNNEFTNIANESKTKTRQITMEKECGCGMDNIQSASSSPSYIYALGRIGYVFPNDGVRNEVDLAVRENSKPAKQTKESESESQTLYRLFTDLDLRDRFLYLSRRLCWILIIDGVPTYVLAPSDPIIYDALIESLKNGERGPQERQETDLVDVIVGEKGPISPPGMCGGYTLPIVTVSRVQTFSFDDAKAALREQVTKAYNKNSQVSLDSFQVAVATAFERVMAATINEGSEPEDRALNFAAIRSSGTYVKMANSMILEEFRLYDIKAQRKQIGADLLVDVIFVLRKDLLEDMLAITVNVTHMFPYFASLTRPFVSG